MKEKIVKVTFKQGVEKERRTFETTVIEPGEIGEVAEEELTTKVLCGVSFEKDDMPLLCYSVDLVRIN